MLEFGHEAVEDGLCKTDGAGRDCCVALDLLELDRGAILRILFIWQANHVVDDRVTADENYMAGFKVAIICVHQPELLLSDFFFDFRVLNDLVEHFEELEARVNVVLSSKLGEMSEAKRLSICFIWFLKALKSLQIYSQNALS